jgi:hypothetical protein
MRYGSRLKCVNVGSHIWRKEEEKKHKLTIFESEKIFFTFRHFRQSEQILYCSAKFQISNITKILKLENRPMIINIFLPSWFPISFIRLQFEALKYTIPHNYIFTILYLFLKYLTLSESDEGYSRNATCAIHFISTFLLLSLG